MSERRLTVREVAIRLGFQPRTITRWCRDGQIKAEKWGRVWRIREADVQKLEKTHEPK
jgi:excisionase family DNA binding protein